jgi:hypothetical protein
MHKIQKIKRDCFGHLRLEFGIYQNIPEYPPALLGG